MVCNLPSSTPASNSIQADYSPSLSADVLLGTVLSGWLQLIGILGVGAYGVVYLARDITYDTLYAVKALRKLGIEPRQAQFQARELALHAAASTHENVVSLLCIIDSPENTFVVLEFCPEGDLFSNITCKGRYVGNDELARSAFLQILDAVEFCHSLGIYHRDLKPENILVAESGKTVKLADFGLATTDAVSSDFGCGSTFYMSPECQQGRPVANSTYASAPNDVWSLGVILINLICGRNPWKRASVKDTTFRAFSQRDPAFLCSILPISFELSVILNKVFEFDPVRRMGITELRHSIMRCERLSAPPQLILSMAFSPVFFDNPGLVDHCAATTVAATPPAPSVASAYSKNYHPGVEHTHPPLAESPRFGSENDLPPSAFPTCTKIRSSDSLFESSSPLRHQSRTSQYVSGNGSFASSCCQSSTASSPVTSPVEVSNAPNLGYADDANLPHGGRYFYPSLNPWSWFGKIPPCYLSGAFQPVYAGSGNGCASHALMSLTPVC